MRNIRTYRLSEGSIMNKWQGIGRVIKDLELKHTGSGTALVSFILAVDGRKKQDGTRETDFVPMLAFGKTAEVLYQYVKKGHRIGVVGRIRTGSYDKEGKRYYTTDIIIEEFDFLEKKEMTRAQFDDGDIDDHNWDSDPMGNDLPF